VYVVLKKLRRRELTDLGIYQNGYSARVQLVELGQVIDEGVDDNPLRSGLVDASLRRVTNDTKSPAV
jgi:hypothetical protein